MRSITVFSTASLFYFLATAVASQPDKLKLYGVPRKAAAASLAIQKAKGEASKLLFHEEHKKKLPTPPKVKKNSPHDPDRRLTQEGSIRGGEMEVSTQHKRSLQDWNTAFEANVAMPIRLQSMMKKASGDSNRRLQTAEVECFYQDNGLLTCVQSDFPGEGLATVFLDCPTDATSFSECQSCAIVVTADDTPNEIDLENDPQCLSCGLCPETLAWDCSNLFNEGDCIFANCDGCVDDPPPPPSNNSTCEDVPGWSDSLGLTCEVYAMAPELCQIFGPEYANNGLTASEACCACGTSMTPPPHGVVYGLQPSCNTVDNDKYNMCLDLESLSGSYESWMEAFAEAMQRWESIIVGDLPSISSSEMNEYQGPEFTGTGYPSTIDDVYIYAREMNIDGEGEILGQALPLTGRGSGVINPRTGEEYFVALSGRMEFDSADIAAMQADGIFDEVVFHEMSHVIGMGTLWEDNGLYIQGSGEYASGTYADAEWKAIGCSGPLPVELYEREGTDDAYWEEDCLGNEILTGFQEEDPDTSQPVSRISIATFQDMGYEVDYSQADPFTISDLGVCGYFCPEAGRRLRQSKRKMKAKLSSEDLDVIMRYAKSELTKLHEEFEIAAVARGDRDDGIKAAEELFVLYQDATGRVHSVHVTWDEAKDLEI